MIGVPVRQAMLRCPKPAGGPAGDDHHVPLCVVGFIERVQLPKLTGAQVEAKLDTGAATSSLHATEITVHEHNGSEWVDFVTIDGPANARLVDRRRVRSSNGQSEDRVVIETEVRLAGTTHRIQVTLADRSGMAYPMLIGREALAGRYLVDSGAEHLT